MQKEYKFLFDKTFSILGLILLSPIFLFIGILIKVIMPDGPIIFKQKRIGQFGIAFTMYKYRTMITNHSGSSVSVKGEHRITPLGRILRRYKLDELPELFNIARGEMSFVGPRPDVPGFADKLEGEDRKILLLKPGITGPASLKYSNEEEILSKVDDPIEYNKKVIFPDKVKINLNYYYNHNLISDISIIFRTIFRQDY